MRRTALIALASFAFCIPATAAPWGTFYNMGTFAAGAGSDAEGWLSLECGDPQAGVADYGELNLLLTTASGAGFDKAKPLDYVQFTIGDVTVDMPMEFEAGSTERLVYVHEAEGAVLTQDLVAVMRQGERVSVTYEGAQLADITLEGADAALEAIDSCIHFRS